jgi:diguanylate cyclase (GGDEF)-like protein/PAS domain S-box-containing protein
LNPSTPDNPTSHPTAWWPRVHAALMPDYNRKATVYWWSIVAIGAAVLLAALVHVARLPAEVALQVVVGAVIAMLAGFFPIRILNAKNSVAAGEIFIFLLLLLHGPFAAVIAAAGEGFIGSYRTSKRWTSRIFSPAMAAVSMGMVGWLTLLTLEFLKGHGITNAGLQLAISMLLGFSYFVLNTLMVTTVLRLKRNEPFVASEFFGNFGWVGVAYAGSAAVATLLVLALDNAGMGLLMAMVPLLVLLLATLHYFFRQQESAEAARQTAAEAQLREAELAARHVRELEASERRFHSAFTHASIGMALLSFEGHILQANPALRTLLGIEDATCSTLQFEDFVAPMDRSQLRQQLGLVDGHEFEGFSLELRCLARDGSQVWVATHCSFFSEPGASTPCLIMQVQDITARRKAEADLHHFAFHDSLTGLPNRRRFHDFLTQAIEAAAGDPAQAFGVMFLDFDRFKLINDSLGHRAGDDFLIQVSRRIQEHLRPGDIVARLGGDEFAVLVHRLDHERIAVNLAERLMEALARPFKVADTEITTSASIGITFSALGYQASDEVLRDADTAMYKAKAAGKARYALFDASLHTEVAERLRLEGELRRAIDEGQLSVEYQPMFELNTKRLRGFEALARWAHPTDGNINPSAFIPIAEETGLIVRLSDFVLHCACRQLREWQRLDPSLADLQVNVNVSGNDIAHRAFVARVSRALVESGLKPRTLTLELTENILAEQIESARPLLDELRELGVGLAIDDFGTGYSSLSHLSALPIDTLKIDRSFVHRLRSGSKDAAVVQAVVVLGSSLGKSVVAEGIETLSQFDQLNSLGCEFGQGYHLSRPLTPPQARALIERQLLTQAQSSPVGMPMLH